MKKTPRFPSVRQMIVESALRELVKEDWEGHDSLTRQMFYRPRREWRSRKMEWGAEDNIGSRPYGSETNPFYRSKHGEHPYSWDWHKKTGKESDYILDVKRDIAQLSDTSLYAGLLNRTTFGYEDYQLLKDELERRADGGNKRAKRLLTIIRKREELSADVNGYSPPREISMKDTDRLFKKYRVDPAREFLKSDDFSPKYAPDKRRWDVEREMALWKNSGMLDSEEDDEQ